MLKIIIGKENLKMITRLDVVKNSFGRFELTNTKNIPSNWFVTMIGGTNSMIVASTHKDPNDKVYPIQLEEGSLFLVNKSNAYYCYFRKKYLQDLYDKYNIVKVNNIKDGSDFYVLKIVKNNCPQNEILKIKGLKLVDEYPVENPTHIFIRNTRDEDFTYVNQTYRKYEECSEAYIIQRQIDGMLKIIISGDASLTCIIDENPDIFNEDVAI